MQIHASYIHTYMYNSNIPLDDTSLKNVEFSRSVYWSNKFIKLAIL